MKTTPAPTGFVRLGIDYDLGGNMVGAHLSYMDGLNADQCLYHFTPGPFDTLAGVMAELVERRSRYVGDLHPLF